MTSDQFLSSVLAGLLGLLLIMIFINVLGAPRRRRRSPGSSQRWNAAGDSSGGADVGPLLTPRGKGSRWDGGGDNDADNGGDGGGGGGGD